MPKKSKKHWRVEIIVEDDSGNPFSVYAYVYIHANHVTKTAHDTVLADGVAIGLPGSIKKIKEQVTG